MKTKKTVLIKSFFWSAWIALALYMGIIFSLLYWTQTVKRIQRESRSSALGRFEIRMSLFFIKNLGLLILNLIVWYQTAKILSVLFRFS